MPSRRFQGVPRLRTFGEIYAHFYNGAQEVFADAYTAIVLNDAIFADMFPNVVNYIKKELRL